MNRYVYKVVISSEVLSRTWTDTAEWLSVGESELRYKVAAAV